MNDGFDFPKKNNQPNNNASNKCKVTHPAAKATANHECLDYQNYFFDSSFVQPYNNDTIPVPNGNQVNISCFPSNKKFLNRTIHMKNDTFNPTAQNPGINYPNQHCNTFLEYDYSSSDDFRNTLDTGRPKLSRNELINQNSFDSLGFQKTLQASAKSFIPTTKITEVMQNQYQQSTIENNVGICLSEPAKNFIKHDLQTSSSVNNGTRPKELYPGKYDRSQLPAHTKDMNITDKKCSRRHQNYRLSNNDNYFHYESTNAKNQCNNWNYHNGRDFEKASGRGKPPSYKKFEWKNSVYNQYQSFPHHNNERYDNQNQPKSNLSERGRFNGRAKSYGNNYNRQSSKNIDYVGNHNEQFYHDRQETSYQNRTAFCNNKENGYIGSDKNYLPWSNKKFERNNKFVKPKINRGQSNSITSGSNLQLQKSDEGRVFKTKLNNLATSENNIKEESILNIVSQSTVILDGRTQRETLIDLLSQGLFECMVCCERIKQSQAIWSCCKCYNCFHLGCTKKWAGASQGDPGWRCPACQNLNAKVPSGYYCFCKKMREPEWNRREIAHSCGEVCSLKRENEWCTHKCTDLCHPGPCPDCSAFVKRQCRCGKNTKEMRCSITEPYLCGEKCLKPLSCGVHFCQQTCHIESCETCTEIIQKNCYCGKEVLTALCTQETSLKPSFSCDNICNKILSCGSHSCQNICHPESCDSCDKLPDVVKSCPCGMVNLNSYYEEKGISPRSLCTDPIPTCNNICNKILKCGTPGSYHTCQSQCHTGLCPPCPKLTAVKCRCGFVDKNIPCTELLTKADEVTCERQCKKLRQCGKHKCGVKCCIDVDHICDRICSRTLKCRLHKCQEPCHRGNCPRCWETSFEELSCHCGASVIYPPVPCGTEAPSCNLPCKRQQSCSHSVSHNCHVDPKCPPCTTLVSKPCFGGHTTMKSTPCYINGMSCGDQCAKMLPCKIHKCQKVCHDGSCIKGAKCTQNCTERRNTCEHACNNTCHVGPCPNNPCKEIVSVTCVCGNRKVEMVCSENDKEYKSLATSKLASMMHNMNNGVSVDLSHLFFGSNKVEKFQRLECNEECGLIARNRRLALALQITNPDSRELLGENNLYPESMKDEARKDMQFAKMVHNSLNDLVLKAKESKQKNRSHSFAPMNRDKRRFIHEYSKFFACQSQSYDEEPKKNVVVTACKQMSRLPPISLVSVIQKELGQRKVPGPVLPPRKNVSSDETPNSMKKLEKSSSFEKKEPVGKTDCSDSCTVSSDISEKKPPTIDYFDFS